MAGSDEPSYSLCAVLRLQEAGAASPPSTPLVSDGEETPVEYDEKDLKVVKSSKYKNFICRLKEENFGAVPRHRPSKLKM